MSTSPVDSRATRCTPLLLARYWHGTRRHRGVTHKGIRPRCTSGLGADRPVATAGRKQRADAVWAAL